MAVDFIRAQSSTSYPVQFLLVQTIDHTTGATGKTVTITASKNGGALGSISGAVTELTSGWYSWAGNATDRATLGELALHITATGADTVDMKGMIVTVDMFAAQLGLTLPTNFTSLLINSTGQVQPDTVLLTGTASAGGANTITLAGATATDNLYKYAIVGIVGGTGAGQARLIIDYVGSTKVATVNKNWTTNPDNTSIFRLTPFGTPAVVHSGIAQAGAASTITLQSVASATDSIYNSETITIFSGTGAFQSRIIKSYVGSTKVATLDQAWVTNPDSTSVYEISALGPSWADVFAWNGTVVSTPATAGIPEVDVKNINNITTTSVTTVSANQGTTQPVNFTGTGASALAKSDVTDIAGAAVSTSTAQLGVNAVNWAGGAIPAPNVTGVPLIDIKYLLGTIFTEGAVGRLVAGIKQFFNVASPTSTMNEVTLVDTATVATTATNLTNAPTAGDFTAAMKTSLNAATPASVTGAVGSVTGNIGGNVVGSVGSVVATVAANLTQILGTALTETVTGYLTAAFKKFFNVASPVMDVTSVNQTGDSYVRLGAPAGASISADIAEVEGETDTLLTNVAAIPTTPVLTAHFDTIIGTPVVSVSADIAEIEAETDGIAAIPTNPVLATDLVVRRGTAQAGAASSITLDSGASAIDSFYVTPDPISVLITAGPGAGQLATPTAYNGTTKVLTISGTWLTNPTNASSFVLLASGGGSGGGSSLTAAQVWNYVGSTALSEDTTLAAIYQKTLASPIQFINPFIVVNKTLGPIVAGDAYTTANSRQIDMPVPGNVPINSTASTPSLKLPNEDGTEQTIIGVGVQISSQWYARFQLTSVQTALLAISSAGQNITYAAKAIATADSTILTVQQGPLIVSASL